MSRWIVDASVALGWFLIDESDRTYALDVLAGVESNEIVVPPLWIYEVVNGLISASRRKRLAREAIFEALGELKRLCVMIEPVDPGDPVRIAELGMAHALTAYDAAYLDLALRMRLPLATTDAALRRAMESCGVDLVSPRGETE